jgi:hypothetical protein
MLCDDSNVQPLCRADVDYMRNSKHDRFFPPIFPSGDPTGARNVKSGINLGVKL